MRIREAAAGLLAEKGFEAWGINAIARAAGCDKVLIYRYFESLDGLLEAVMAGTTLWPDPARLPEASAVEFLSATYQHFRANPVIFALLGHPDARQRGSAIGRTSATSLESWLEGFADRCGTRPTDERILNAAGRLLMSCLHGLPDPARDIWQTLSPALDWKPDESEPLPGPWNQDPLPTELL